MRRWKSYSLSLAEKVHKNFQIFFFVCLLFTVLSAVSPFFSSTSSSYFWLLLNFYYNGIICSLSWHDIVLPKIAKEKKKGIRIAFAQCAVIAPVAGLATDYVYLSAFECVLKFQTEN